MSYAARIGKLFCAFAVSQFQDPVLETDFQDHWVFQMPCLGSNSLLMADILPLHCPFMHPHLETFGNSE